MRKLMLYAMCSSMRGRMKRLELKGKIFGYVTVIGFSHIDRHGSTMWIGRCICGVEKVFRGEHLRKGFSTSCGCKKRLRGLENPMSTGYGEIPGHRWGQFKKSAEVRGIKFAISIKQAWELFLKQERKCALSGVVLEFGKPGLISIERSRVMNASLDRKDSTKGYTLDNVQWVHKVVNRMKNTAQDNEFVAWCLTIARYKGRL